jgi:hypothetical protein
MSDKKWVRSSLRKLEKALGKQGYKICRMTVRRLLKDLEYSLQANCKRFTGPPHPDRSGISRASGSCFSPLDIP